MLQMEESAWTEASIMVREGALVSSTHRSADLAYIQHLGSGLGV